MEKLLDFEVASKVDMPRIIQLLENNELPTSDLDGTHVIFLKASEADNLVGCIGLELHGDHGLLRSLAVSDLYKNQRVGQTLLANLFGLAKRENIKTLHLLTTTAAGYFEARGFNVQERNSAPKPIQDTKEFSQICPSNSVYMTITLER